MKFLTILFLSILLWSCSSLKINKFNDVNELTNNALSYDLPQSEIWVELELEKTTFLPGPYSSYAKEFLELDLVKKNEAVIWRIKGVSLESSSLVDTSQNYIISGPIERIKAENLSQILSKEQTLYNASFIAEDNSSIVPDFPELTLKKLLIEQSKTSYKTVTVDSVTKRVPVTNTVVRNKTLEEMAKDASKTLLKIRKRKFRLITGVNEKLPKDKALEQMLDELNKKEDYYLSLFIGKEKREYTKVNYIILPVAYQKHNICSFDPQNGIVQDTLENTNIILNVEMTGSGNSSLSAKYKQTEDLLPYRKPQIVKVTVEQNQKPIIIKEMSIPQLGTIEYIPLKFLMDYKIKMDSKSGALIGIEK